MPLVRSRTPHRGSSPCPTASFRLFFRRRHDRPGCSAVRPELHRNRAEPRVRGDVAEAHRRSSRSDGPRRTRPGRTGAGKNVLKLCPGTGLDAEPRFIRRGFCPTCHIAVRIHPDGACKRHYPDGRQPGTRRGITNRNR